MTKTLKKDKKYTYQDYLEWPNGERWEIIEGVAYNMTPAPGIMHQNIVSNLHIRLKTDPKNSCYTGIAPTDVILDDYNTVQPDVFVVCEKNKMTENNIQGPPDLIIEVVSPGTEVKDRREKKGLYERFGVKEYVIVFPEREYVERYMLEGDRYSTPEILNWDEVLTLPILDMRINLWEIFEKKKKETETQAAPGS